MNDKTIQRVESIVGFVVLAAVIVGFLFYLLINLPTKNYSQTNAKTLSGLPDLSDTVSNEVKSLNVPDGVPVKVNSDMVGRGNAFQGY